MRNKTNIIIVCVLFTIMACNSNKQQTKIEKNEFESIDTILKRNQENFTTVNRASEKSDSSISEKVEKTVDQIKTLKNEIKELKEENNELKIKINDANDVGWPFHLLPVSDGKNNR